MDKVLLPPAGSVLEVMRNAAGEFSKFLELVSAAGMEVELAEFQGPFTVLAPTDEAFQHLGENLDFEEVNAKLVLCCD